MCICVCVRVSFYNEIQNPCPKLKQNYLQYYNHKYISNGLIVTVLNLKKKKMSLKVKNERF